MTSPSAALIDSSGAVSRLSRVDSWARGYDESWLRSLLASNPFLLSAGSFGPLYDNPVCIGEEIPVGNTGRIDCLFATPAGGVIIAETKSFYKPEAKTLVSKRVFDYAKIVQTWDCASLDKISLDYYFKTAKQGFRVIDKMAQLEYLTFQDEARFTDSVNRNLASGHVLLIIVADSTCCTAQDLTDFIGSNVSAPCDLSVLGIEIYRSSDSAFVLPRPITRA